LKPPALPRVAAYVGLALVAAGALSARSGKLPSASIADLLTAEPRAGGPVAATRALVVAPVAPPAPAWVARHDTLGRGESLRSLFGRLGVSVDGVLAALRETPEFDERRVPAGLAVVARNLDTATAPTEITLQFAVDRAVKLEWSGEGWTGREERLTWTTDTATVGGTVTSSLYEALEDGAGDLLPARQRAELVWTIADILEYRVDMSRDLKEGDAFRVLFERSRTETGATRLGRVLAVSMQLSGDTVEAIRHGEAKGTGRYYDQEGKSLRAAFLRAPLEFRRISSVFGMRKHPILKTWRAHKGTDYAASSGTPVRAIGEGTVIYAGRRSGYGNVVEIKHPNGYVSRYAHLRKFGTRRGARVGIGETIGQVGMTGLATAPHLHFEVLVNGTQRDPRVALSNKSGVPLTGKERAEFQRSRVALLAAMDRAPGATRLAVAND
jgi:murein DD-endopeptidase MepM/ murein hydrolase activator NlpD